MKVGAYYETASAEVMDTAVLRDWMDRLQDWTPDAIRKAFWAWQDQQPNRRPGPGPHPAHPARNPRAPSDAGYSSPAPA